MIRKDKIPKYILPLVIVIAVIILILSIEPLRTFFKERILGISQKVTLIDRGLTIESINEISKLTTAEYFGETYCTDRESEWIKPEKYKKQLEREYESYFYQMKIAIEEILIAYDLLDENGNISSKRKLRKLLRIHKPELVSEDKERYENLVIKGSRNKKSEIMGLEEIYTSTWEKVGDEADFYFGINMLGMIESELGGYTKEYHKNKNKNKPEIIYLGRGLVTAGIDLTKLNSDNYDPVDPNDDWIEIEGIEVEIFDSIINPWFIPNEQPGFELYYVEKKRKATFEEATRVKIKCLSHLKSDAIKMGIKLQALESAEETLSDMARLNNDKLKGIIFSSESYYDLQFEAINTDFRIDRFELINLKHFVQKWHNKDINNDGRFKTLCDRRKSLLELRDKLNQLVKNDDEKSKELTCIFDKIDYLHRIEC